MFTCIYKNLSKLFRFENLRRKRRETQRSMVPMGNKNRKHRKQGSCQDEKEKDSSLGAAPAAVEAKPTTIRLATFNTALFSMASAIFRKDEGKHASQNCGTVDVKGKSVLIEPSTSSGRNTLLPRSILKQNFPSSPSASNSSSTIYPQKILKNGDVSKSRLRVTINLPDNEISLSRLRHSTSEGNQDPSSSHQGIVRRTNSMKDLTYHSKTVSEHADFPFPQRHSISSRMKSEMSGPASYYENSNQSRRSILEVLKEVDADLIALQEVKAEEEKGMNPLSELAEALGMNYVYAESWAPEYGNAVLSKWPIKRWDVQKIVDDSDFRNVLKVVVDVPIVGELHFYCTQLDHLDEGWRMKQIMAIMNGDREGTPHILIGGLNSLDTTDYSEERWEDIVKFNEDKGKPTPKAEVMKLLKAKGYIDAKHFAGDCESVVVIARGQEVQGTCKYGTRVDYILASRNAPYKFVPGSYAVVSSKGTSDHHVVKVDIQLQAPIKPAHRQKKTVRVWQPSPRGIWQLN